MDSLQIPIPKVKMKVVLQKKLLGIFVNLFYIQCNTGVPRAIKLGAREE